MTTGTTVLALVLSAASPSAGQPQAATGVAVEVFSVGFPASPDAGLRFTRGEAALAHGQDPDSLGRSLAAGPAAAIAAIHSTSWRWEPDGRIVLTYVAWMKDGGLGPGARALPPLPSPGPTDPLHPRPPRIRELDPLAHGLRHLAFLVQQDRTGALRAALGVRPIAALRSFEPAVAGRLP